MTNGITITKDECDGECQWFVERNGQEIATIRRELHDHLYHESYGIPFGRQGKVAGYMVELTTGTSKYFAVTNDGEGRSMFGAAKKWAVSNA